MSKTLYIGTYATSLCLFLLSFVSLMTAYVLIGGKHGIRPDIGISLLLLTIIGYVQFSIVQFIYLLVITSKMWAAIQDEHTRSTPGKAVAFLFVTFFNLYWIFQVWGGFPTDYNAYVDRYGLPVPHVSAGVYNAFPILILLSVIPIVGVLTAIIGLFVFLAMVARICDAVNRLSEAVQERRQAAIGHARIQNQAVAII